MKLHHIINKMKKWIKILEAKIKILPKYVLLITYSADILVI